MKNTRADICRLLIVLSVFGASIWFMNDHKKKIVISTHVDMANATPEGVGQLSIDTAYDYIYSLLISRNTYLTVKLIGQFSYQPALELMKKIITEKEIPTTNEEKMKILFGVASHFQAKKNILYQFFDLLLEHDFLYGETPALYVVAKSKYKNIIPNFLHWIKEREKDPQYSQKIELFIDVGLESAIEHDDLKSLEVMVTKKVPLASQKALELLWQVVVQNKKTSFVPFLVRRAKADVNYVGDGKRTLLIKAAELNNVDMVQALLEEGAKIDTIVDPEIGSALQIAIEHGYTEIDMLLREYGARE